jgi:biopolymer transport protein ExbD
MQSRSVLFALCLALLALFIVTPAFATEMNAELAVSSQTETDAYEALGEEDEDEGSSFVDAGSDAEVDDEPAQENDVSHQMASTSRPNGLCEICNYVIENKQRRQPYLCRGLKDANYQKYCVRVMESLMWWNNNQVYWINYGCERLNNGAKEWIRPCPASAICSWLQDFEIKDSFCPTDPVFPKPE